MPPRARKDGEQTAAEQVAAPAADEHAPSEPTDWVERQAETEDAVRRVVRALVNQRPIEGDPVPDWLLTVLRDELPDEPEPGDEPDLCPQCFPNGWAGLAPDAYAAGCEHGQYLHAGRAPKE